MPTGEAGETTVLATAAGEVSIIKNIFAEGTYVLVGNGTHKLIVISIIGWLVTGRKLKNIIILGTATG